MSVIVKTIHHLKHRCSRPIILRLCNTDHCVPFTSYISKRTLISLQRFPEKHVYPFPHRGYANVSLKAMEDTPEYSNTSNYIPESTAMHMTLMNSSHYTQTIMPNIISVQSVDDVEVENLLNKDWSSADILDVYNAMKKIAYSRLGNNVLLEPERYENIIQALADKLPQLPDEKLRTIFKYLKPLCKDYQKCNTYLPFIKTLNKECINRLLSRNIDELLLICDGFYQIYEPNSDFMWRAIRKISNKIYKLPPKTLVQYAFFLGECRKPPVNMYEIEYRLGECLDDLSPNEIGIIARGFFKTQTRFRSGKLVNLIIKCITNGIQSIDNVNLAAAMKQIRYSIKLEEIPVFRILLTAIVPELPRLSLMCMTHIAHVAANTGIYEKELMRIIIERLKNDVSFVRIKDIERIVYAVCMVCPESDENGIFDVIVTELLGTFQTSRSKEIEQYPNTLPRILEKLSYRDIYPEELFKVALCPKRVNKLMQIQLFSRDLWSLHCNILIDRPHYTGPHLSEGAIRHAIKKFGINNEQLHEENKPLKLLNEVAFRCKEILSTDVCVTQVLPNHVSKDIILGFDENDKPVPVEDILSQMSYSTIKRVDTDELKKIKWKALVIIPVTQIVKGTNEYIGVIKAKLRHLRIIGYTPIEISQIAWERCYTDEEKLHFLRKQINNR